MLNYKKIFVLGIAAMAILAGLTKIRMNRLAPIKSESCIETSCFPKADDFSIINILSVKFG